MMLDTPSLSHQPPTPPGSPPTPSSPSGATSSLSAESAACSEGAVSAELAQQANEVCQLVAKANRAPHGLHADELRRLLSDIHSLHILAQQLSPSSPLSTTTSASSASAPSASPSKGRAGCGTNALGPLCGIAKKKPIHHSAVLSRPLCSSAPAATATSQPPPSPLLSQSSSLTPSPAQVRGCTPIRPRTAPTMDSTASPAQSPSNTVTAAAASTSTTTTSPSAPVESANGPRACANCGTSHTVQWRCGADGKPSLCNACGLRYRYNLKKKALYEDIASVRAMTQRSPPFMHSPRSAPSSPSSIFTMKASRSPPFVGTSPVGSVSASPPATMAAACPPRPSATVVASSTETGCVTSRAGTSDSDGRRSNIYSLLN